MKNTRFKHYNNGKVYTFCGFIKNKTTNEDMVLYRGNYGVNGDCQYYVREKSDFFGMVEEKNESRYTLLED